MSRDYPINLFQKDEIYFFSFVKKHSSKRVRKIYTVNVFASRSHKGNIPHYYTAPSNPQDQRKSDTDPQILKQTATKKGKAFHMMPDR